MLFTKPANPIQDMEKVPNPPISPYISLVIPAYNEEKVLPALLDSVVAAKKNYSRGMEHIEVIVADNCSTDETAAISYRYGCLVVQEEKRIIAAVRNAGARASRGKVLAFIDADSVIHPRTFDVIENTLASGKVIAGATGVKMERLSLGIMATLACFLPVVWITGMDSGVVFCEREDFLAINGYDETRPYAEDVDLLWRLRARGKSSGRRLHRARSAKAITSARKFDQHGEWHYFQLMLRGLYGMFFSTEAAWRVAKDYWYVERRG